MSPNFILWIEWDQKPCNFFLFHHNFRRWAISFKKILYFTDGCGAQYKNKYNFVNVCLHEHDFGVPCEWLFFATAHGKGACDGIGGTVKRAVANESLMRPVKDQILTARAMFEYVTEKFVSVIEFLFVTKEEVRSVSKELETRFSTAMTIKGTRRCHRICPDQYPTVRVHKLATDSGQIVRCAKWLRLPTSHHA